MPTYYLNFLSFTNIHKIKLKNNFWKLDLCYLVLFNLNTNFFIFNEKTNIDNNICYNFNLKLILNNLQIKLYKLKNVANHLHLHYYLLGHNLKVSLKSKLLCAHYKVKKFEIFSKYVLGTYILYKKKRLYIS